MFTGPCDGCTSQRCGGTEIMGMDLQEEGFDLPHHGVLDKAAKLTSQQHGTLLPLHRNVRLWHLQGILLLQNDSTALQSVTNDPVPN